MKKVSITSSRKLTVLPLIWYLATALGCAHSGQTPLTSVAPDGNKPPWIATALDFQAAVAAGRRLMPMGTVDHDVPDGFLGYTIMVDRGYGSYHISVPRFWIGWWVGHSPMRLLDAASKVDAKWASRFRPRLESATFDGESSLRGLFLADEKAAIMSLSILMRGYISEEQWRAVIEKPELLRKRNAEMMAADVVQHTAGQAIMVDWRVPALEEDLVQIEYYILEINNQMLWSLGCQSLAGVIGQYRQVCADIVATFFAGPYIKLDQE